MLNYFPRIYDDELLYSVVSRYAYKMGVDSTIHILHKLFDKYNVVLSVDFPCRIRRFVEKFPNVFNITCRDVVFNNTIFPLFYPFLDINRQERIFHKMLSDNGRDIHMTIGSMASNLEILNYLRYCPVCIKEDYDKYGEAYWHRSHNVPGAYICYKHNSPLSEREGGEYVCNLQQQKLISLTELVEKGKILKGEQPIIRGEWNRRERQLLFECANSIHGILNYNFCNTLCDIEKIRNIYFHKLDERGLVINGVRVRQEEMKREIIAYYGENILSLLKLSFTDQGEYSWVKSLLNKRKNMCHPLKHILIINWLYNGNVEAFIKDTKREYHSFKESHWPCLNPGAEHYKEDIIKGYKIRYDSKKKYHFIVFECQCGYIYTRKLDDIHDRFKISRVIQYGGIWEDKLKELMKKKKLSKVAIARQLNVHVSTVNSYAIKLGILSGEKNNKLDERKQKSYSIKSKKEKEIRDRLITYVTSNRISRAELEKSFPKEVHWLNSNNKILFKSIMKNCCHQISTRVDWEKRDHDLCNKVKKEVEKLRRTLGSPRITISKVGKNIGHLGLLQKHLDKLPLTKEVLNESMESIEEYKKRKSYSSNFKY